MARHIPTKFLDKLHDVQVVLDAAGATPDVTSTSVAKCCLACAWSVSRSAARPIVLSLWSLPVDIVEICGDAAYPATAALLAIDAEQAKALRPAGVLVDLSQLTRSDSVPGLYYALFDHLSQSRCTASCTRSCRSSNRTTVACWSPEAVGRAEAGLPRRDSATVANGATRGAGTIGSPISPGM